MTKKIVLYLLALSAIAIYSCKTNYPKADLRYTLIESPAARERGENLTWNVCGQCHYNRETGKFTGTQMKDLPKFMGKVYAANITQSTTYGELHQYTNAELAYLIKTGITHDGKYIPYMIRPTMADDDVNDIISYLRSEAPEVKPGDINPGNTKIKAFGKLATQLSGKPQPYLTGIKRPANDDAVASGRYLVDIIGCFHCHSKSIISLNYLHAEESKGYMAGGLKFKDENGRKVWASNLSPDKETGIGMYTNAEFFMAVTQGKALGGRELRYPMKRFKHLTQKQSDDIFAYLKTLPAAHHVVKGR